MNKSALDLVGWLLLFMFALFLWAGIVTFGSSKSAIHEISGTLWIIGSVLSLGFSAVIFALLHILEQGKKK